MSERKTLSVLMILVWFLLSFANVAMILKFASPHPISDDWSVLESVDQIDEMNMAWVTESKGGFFKPITYLSMKGCYDLFGGDFRWGLIIMFLPVVFASLYITMLVLQQNSGFGLFAIAIPLAMMNLAYFPTVAWFAAAHCGLRTAVVASLSARFMLGGPLRYPVLSSVALMFIGFVQGILGVVLLTPFVLLSLQQAFYRKDSRLGSKGQRMTAVMLGFVWCMIVVMAFWMTVTATGGSPEAGTFEIGKVIETYVEFLSMSLGVVARKIWPFGGGVVLSVLVAFGAMVVWKWRRGVISAEQFFTDVLSVSPFLILGVLFGIGRMTQGALIERYAAYCVPLYVALFVVFLKYAQHGIFAKGMLFFLFLVPVSSFWFDVQVGVSRARDSRSRWVQLNRDLEEKMCVERLFARHRIANQNFGWFEHGVRVLRAGGIPGWDQVQDCEFERTDLDLETGQVFGLSWNDEMWVTSHNGERPRIVFSFPRQRVDMVWVDFVMNSKKGSMLLSIEWLPDNDRPFLVQEVSRHIEFNTAEAVRTAESLPVEINGQTGGIAICPGEGEYAFDLRGVALLVEAKPE